MKNKIFFASLSFVLACAVIIFVGCTKHDEFDGDTSITVPIVPGDTVVINDTTVISDTTIVIDTLSYTITIDHYISVVDTVVIDTIKGDCGEEPRKSLVLRGFAGANPNKKSLIVKDLNLETPVIKESPKTTSNGTFSETVTTTTITFANGLVITNRNSRQKDVLALTCKNVVVESGFDGLNYAIKSIDPKGDTLINGVKHTIIDVTFGMLNIHMISRKGDIDIKITVRFYVEKFEGPFEIYKRSEVGEVKFDCNKTVTFTLKHYFLKVTVEGTTEITRLETITGSKGKLEWSIPNIADQKVDKNYGKNEIRTSFIDISGEETEGQYLKYQYYSKGFKSHFANGFSHDINSEYFTLNYVRDGITTVIVNKETALTFVSLDMSPNSSGEIIEDGVIYEKFQTKINYKGTFLNCEESLSTNNFFTLVKKDTPPPQDSIVRWELRNISFTIPSFNSSKVTFEEWELWSNGSWTHRTLSVIMTQGITTQDYPPKIVEDFNQVDNSYEVLPPSQSGGNTPQGNYIYLQTYEQKMQVNNNKNIFIYTASSQRAVYIRDGRTETLPFGLWSSFNVGSTLEDLSGNELYEKKALISKINAQFAGHGQQSETRTFQETIELWKARGSEFDETTLFGASIGRDNNPGNNFHRYVAVGYKNGIALWIDEQYHGFFSYATDVRYPTQKVGVVVRNGQSQPTLCSFERRNDGSYDFRSIMIGDDPNTVISNITPNQAQIKGYTEGKIDVEESFNIQNNGEMLVNYWYVFNGSHVSKSITAPAAPPSK